MSTINILIGTQDPHLHQLCAPFITAENFYFFDEIHFLSTQIQSMDSPIIVFVDIEWPNNDSGYHVARTVRKRNSESKVFLLTDRTDDVKEHWAHKVNGEILERLDEAFLHKLMPFISMAGIAIPETPSRSAAPSYEKTSVRAPSYERTSVRAPSYEKTAVRAPLYERTAVKAAIGTNPVSFAETELEKILGPMGPLLLQDALVAANGNLKEAIKKVAQFGTTTSEQKQVNELSLQFS